MGMPVLDRDRQTVGMPVLDWDRQTLGMLVLDWDRQTLGMPVLDWETDVGNVGSGFWTDRCWECRFWIGIERR